jgi:hypothetical protein
MKDARYDHLFDMYECGYYAQKPCEGDFNGDGRTGHILIDGHLNTPTELPPEVVDDRQDVFRLKVFSLDNTLRTHMAVREDTGGARLLVWEGVRTESGRRITPVSLVYAWRDGKLSEVEAVAVDREILSAMRARDDAGTWMEWVIYRMLKWPSRVIYGLLIIAAAMLYRRHRRAAMPLP